MNQITLHRDKSGSEVRINPLEISVKAANSRGTFIELTNGFKFTARETMSEISALVEQSAKDVAK